jgi:DNA-binding NarL/FixJ family response regulator
MPATTIMIVDDHPLFSKGLMSLIASQPQYSVVGEARNSAQAMELLREKKPALAIVDLKLGDEDGMELIKNMVAVSPDLIVLVLSMHDERYYSERVLWAGARGYIMKDEAGKKVLDAIKVVLSGKIYLSDSEQERLFEFMTNRNSNKGGTDCFATVRKLSNRQFQIFTLIGKGLGTVEISARLNLSTKTIDTHKEHIKLKLHCGSSQELRELAIEWSKNPPPPPHLIIKAHCFLLFVREMKTRSAIFPCFVFCL